MMASALPPITTDALFAPLSAEPLAEIGVFGGSGFYSLLENPTPIRVETPYGSPSDEIMLGELAGRKVAFLPRHGARHHLPPQKINYRANVWAFKRLGVTWAISPCAAGSLQRHVAPGHFVVCDQYVDRTSARPDTFYDGPVTTHVSAADPFCEDLRRIAVEACKEVGVHVHEKGTVVVIQGPRFSTRAESAWFASQGWEVINMTQYPEVHLVKELGMCPVNISLITDYDAGVDDIPPVSHTSVLEVFNANNDNLKKVLAAMVAKIPTNPDACCFKDVLAHARI